MQPDARSSTTLLTSTGVHLVPSDVLGREARRARPPSPPSVRAILHARLCANEQTDGEHEKRSERPTNAPSRATVRHAAIDGWSSRHVDDKRSETASNPAQDTTNQTPATRSTTPSSSQRYSEVSHGTTSARSVNVMSVGNRHAVYPTISSTVSCHVMSCHATPCYLMPCTVQHVNKPTYQHVNKTRYENGKKTRRNQRNAQATPSSQRPADETPLS